MAHLFGSQKISTSFQLRRAGRKLRKRYCAGIEKLEPRQLLASDVIISEVLASNQNGINDEFGSTSDWIEIYNAGHEMADLTGWFLTDEANDRTKWAFPATTLQPGASLLVFASGADQVGPSGQLHANFQVARDGEYLALFEQDGRTAAYEFNVLPQQYTDVSFGTGQVLTDRTFVSADGASKVLLPGSDAQDLPAATWTSTEFEDSGWADFSNQLGFDDDTVDGDFNPLIAENGQLRNMRGNTSSAYVRTTFEIDSEFLPTYEDLNLEINYDDGFAAYLNGSPIVNVNTPDELAWDSSATQSNGGIADAIGYSGFASADAQSEFTLKGDAAFNGNILRLTSNEANQNGAAWRTTPVEFGSDYTFSASMVFDIHSPGGGLANGDIDGLGGEGMTFVLQSNDNNILGTGGESLGLENTGSTLLAIELDSGATGAFDPDDKLGSHLGINTNSGGSIARTAIPRFNGNAFFEGNPAPGGAGLQYLWVEYDGENTTLDVYYSKTDTQPAAPTLSAVVDLNEHFAGVPSLYAGWTGTTSEAFNGHDVVAFNIITGVGELGRDPVTINLRNHIGKLKTGTNVLAFHGLNVNADDEDFLLIPRLTAKEVTLTEDVAFFTKPSPGELNGEAGEPPAGAVTISEPTKLFVDAFNVELTSAAENAVIRYTLDGTIPDTTSTLYEGPITISESMRLRARAFEPDRSPGPINTSGFTQLDSSLVDFEKGQMFQSNLPVVILDSFDNRRIDSESVRMVPSSGIFIDPGDDGVANLLDTPDYAGLIGARIRGQSSQGWAKKQYAVEIIEDGEFDASSSNRRPPVASELQDKSVSIFDFPVESDWVLNGPYSDKSQLNNYLTFNWFNEIGTYAPRARLVEVFVNADGGTLNYKTGPGRGDYRGTYVMLEKIKVDKNRVDITRLEPGDVSEPEITGGYIWKKDKTGAEDLNIVTGVRRQEVRIIEPGCSDVSRARTCASGEISDEQITWLKDHLTEFEEALYGDNYRDPNEGYAKFIDVPSWVDTWLMVEFTKNIDGFRLSTYYHKDRGGKIKQGPAWDYNLALGNADYLAGGQPTGWYGDLIDSTAYPYWDRLFADPAFGQAVSDRWTELRRSTFTTENLLADIDAAVGLISNDNPNLDRPAAGEPSNPISRNFDRWTTGGYGTGVYHWPNCFFNNDPDCARSPIPGGRPRVYGDYIIAMKWFVENRAEWMDSQLASPIEVTPDPGVVEKGTQITLSGPRGYDVYYTTDGSDPQEPLTIIEQHTVIGENNPVDYLVPSNNSMVGHCDDGIRLNNAARCFMNPDYVLGANGETWSSGTLGLGYDAGNDFDPFINTDIQGDIQGSNGSVYLRIPFDVSDEVDRNAENMSLNVQYDDGFVVYSWLSALDSPVEVARSNAPGEEKRFPINAQSFDATATEDRSDAAAVNFQSFDVSNSIQNIRGGTNYLIVQLLNNEVNSDDLLFDVRLTITTERTEESPSKRKYEGPITIDRNSQLFARGLHPTNGDWTSGFRGTYIVDIPQLEITEINYNPAAPTQQELAILPGVTNEDFEFVELANTGDLEANLIGTQFTNGLAYEFGNVDLANDARGLVVKNQQAFELRYGTDHTILGVYNGSLDNNGETLTLVNVAGELLSNVTYDNGNLFSEAPDGNGATLQLIGGNADKYYNWRHSTENGGSPGTEGADAIGVVVNEILSNSADDPDAIELLNTTASEIIVGGWFVSDSTRNLRKYEIPAGTAIGPNQRLVIAESAFNADPNDPNSFALNGTMGDDLWITIQDENGVVSFVDDVHFRAALAGESFARVPDGTGRLAPMSQVTLGDSNASPRVGPVIITEVSYNPPEPSEAALALYSKLISSDLEFIEIHNPTASQVDMTDWRIRGGVDLNFSVGDSIGPNETIVMTSFNPANEANFDRLAAFRAHYGINQNVRLIGGYAGQLSGNYDRITMLSRDISFIDQPVVLPLIVQDEVVYDDQSPWPVAADGLGSTLHRIASDAYGNAASSWVAADPNPGQVSLSDVRPGDVDQNGVVNADDIDLVCREIHAAGQDMRFDLNGDGAVNLADQQYLVQNILGTSIGDSNLDGIFNSSDLVKVLQTGGYEDAVAGNATWASGDWNCDGDFDSGDLVAAFAAGGYSAAAVAGQGLSANVAAAIVDVDAHIEIVGNDVQSDQADSQGNLPQEAILSFPDDIAQISRDQVFALADADDDLIDEDLLEQLAT